MSEMVMITVTYDMVFLDSHTTMSIDLAVLPRIAGILVHDRPCSDNTASKSAIVSIISGLSRLKGCSYGTIKSIRYAQRHEA